MPKILSFTPAWLSNPSIGHKLFTQDISSSNGNIPIDLKNGRFSQQSSFSGARRTVARRGAEVFVAVGKEIRWVDLAVQKKRFEGEHERPHSRLSLDFGSEDGSQGYKTIKTNVADDIHQLIISPNEDYLAILTKHTVHISVLPDSSHLSGLDTAPLRLKTFTLGPTTHVTSQAPIASALWHPLGVNGTAIVTVTSDAVVRVWELSVSDRWSFDRPTLAIDLTKLVDGTSLEEDFTASKMGISKGFSPDSFEMEVASACFGSRNSGGWSPMTLWIAMREGDVYALCPLLPEKWAPPPALIPSLTVSIVANAAAMDDNTDYSDATKRLGRQQLAWMADLDNQEPQPVESTVGDFDVEVYTRPHKPGKVPKLQGPFKIEGQPEEGDNELETLLSDILFIGAKADSDMLMDGEDDELEEADEEGLTLGVVCLLSSSGRVTVCLDIDGVEAQWLPRRSVSGKQYHVPEPANQPELLAYQVLDTLRTREIKSMPQEAWPMFTPDTESRYSFYVTNPSNLTYISLSPFVSRLESELQSGDSSGVDFRLDLLAKGENFIRDRLVSEPLSKNQSSELSACQIIRDPSLGHLLLSNSSHGPVAVFLENPSEAAGALTYASEAASQVSDEDYHAPLLLCAPRPVYEPPPAFRTPSALPAYLEQLRLGKQQRLLTEQVRLSPATLTIFADAHKILSEETHRIGSAAAELFRRCEQLQLDLREQIAKANDVAERVEQVVGEDHDDGEAYVTTAEAVEARLEAVERRQEMLLERVERLKRKSNRPLSRQLSDKERAWFEEVAHFQESLASVPESYAAAVVQKPGSRPTSSRGGQKDLGKRFREVRELKEEVSKQFEVFIGKVEKKGDGDGEGPRPDENSIPGEIRREKVAQVQVAIEREEALVAAVKGRLERLAIV